MTSKLIGLALAVLISGTAKADTFAPPPGVDYLPAYGLRDPLFIPPQERAALTNATEALIAMHIGQPAQIVTATMFSETDGSFTFCGVYGAAGKGTIFILNTGDRGKTHEGRLYRDVERDMLGAFGCHGKTGVILR